MVDIGAQQKDPLRCDVSGQVTTHESTDGLGRPLVLRRNFWAALTGTVAIAGLAVVLSMGTASARASSAAVPATPAGQVIPSTTASTASPTPTVPVATPVAPATTVAVPAPAAPPAPQPSVAALVTQAEAAGIVPAATWSWSMGDTASTCGVTSSAGGAAGCTSWSSGVERTVFSGSPSLALVAHEVANAEGEQFALPALLAEVGSDAAGTSWSPTDAVASCLVVHFLGFQDGAAGSWQCPPALATSVADHIHDTVVITHTTAVCGMSSGIISTLTFTASAGTLTVLSPSSSQTAVAGVPLTVSGVGTFTATDQGGTATVAGVCQG